MAADPKWTSMTDDELAREYVNNYSPELQAYMEARKKSEVGTIPLPVGGKSPSELASELAPGVPVGWVRDPITGGIAPKGKSEVQAPAPEPTAQTGGEQADVLGRLLSRPSESAQRIAMLEAMKGMPQKISLGSGSRTIRIEPGAYFEDTGRQLAETYRAEKEAAKKAAGLTEPTSTGPLANPEEAFKTLPAPPPPEDSKLGILAKRETLLGKHMDTVGRWVERNKAELEQADFERDKRSRDLKVAEMNLQNAERNIIDAQIDPNRYWTGGIPGAGGMVFGAFKAVAQAVANAFGAYAQGMSRGAIPNTAVQMMEKAMDRDIDAQKANLSKLMTLRGYAKDTRDFVSNSFDKAMSSRKALLLRGQELEVAKMGLEGQRLDIKKEGIDVRERAAGLINELERKALLAEEAARPRKTVTTVSGGHQVLNPMWAAMAKAATSTEKGKPPPVEPGTELRSSLEVVNNLDSRIQKMGVLNPNRFEMIRKMGSDAQDQFNRELLYTLQKYRKATTGAAFTANETEEYMKLFQARLWAGKDPWKSARNFLVDTLRNDYVNRSLRVLQQYPDYRNTLLPTDLRSLARPPTGQQYVGEPR